MEGNSTISNECYKLYMYDGIVRGKTNTQNMFYYD